VLLSEIFQVVDIDTEDSHAVIPRGLDLIIDLLSPGGIPADQHGCTRSSVALIVDPLFDGLIATLLHRLPIIIPRRLVAFDEAHVSDLSSPTTIFAVVEAVEDPPDHRMPRLSDGRESGPRDWF
jgi:hypothetical protein